MSGSLIVRRASAPATIRVGRCSRGCILGVLLDGDPIPGRNCRPPAALTTPDVIGATPRFKEAQRPHEYVNEHPRSSDLDKRRSCRAVVAAAAAAGTATPIARTDRPVGDLDSLAEQLRLAGWKRLAGGCHDVVAWSSWQ